jgi:hypothetical protein
VIRAFRVCEALFAQYPQSARGLDDRTWSMFVTGGDSRLYDLVRHSFHGRRVFFRLPRDAYRRGAVPDLVRADDDGLWYCRDPHACTDRAAAARW